MRRLCAGRREGIAGEAPANWHANRTSLDYLPTMRPILTLTVMLVMIDETKSPAMFSNRISGFYMDDLDDLVEQQSIAPVHERAAFAPLPAFVNAGGNLSGVADIYRLAYEQAQQQVARRRERERHLHEWN